MSMLPSIKLPTQPKFQLPGIFFLLRGRSVAMWLFAGAVACYVSLSLFIYFQWVVPWTAGIIETRIGADSDRYWQAAELAKSNQGLALLTFSGNLLGPVTLANLLGDGFAVMCFNFFILALTIKIGWKIPQINKPLFGFLILLNFELTKPSCHFYLLARHIYSTFHAPLPLIRS